MIAQVVTSASSQERATLPACNDHARQGVEVLKRPLPRSQICIEPLVMQRVEGGRSECEPASNGSSTNSSGMKGAFHGGMLVCTDDSLVAAETGRCTTSSVWGAPHPATTSARSRAAERAKRFKSVAPRDEGGAALVVLRYSDVPGVRLVPGHGRKRRICAGTRPVPAKAVCTEQKPTRSSRRSGRVQRAEATDRHNPAGIERWDDSTCTVHSVSRWTLRMVALGVVCFVGGWGLVSASGYGGNGVGGSRPVWQVGGLMVYASIPVLAVALPLLAVVAVRRVRRKPHG